MVYLLNLLAVALLMYSTIPAQAFDINRSINELSSAENGANVFSSSTGSQSSLEDPAWKNGAFTKALVAGLAGSADHNNSGQALDAEEKRRGPMNSKGLAQLAYEKGMYILTAAQSYQAALEASKLGHGYMTYALVEEGLKSKVGEAGFNGDGQVWLREWFDYTGQRVPRMRAAKVTQTARQGNKALEEEVEQGKVQTPRVFYRREADLQPWIIANAK